MAKHGLKDKAAADWACEMKAEARPLQVMLKRKRSAKMERKQKVRTVEIAEFVETRNENVKDGGSSIIKARNKRIPLD